MAQSVSWHQRISTHQQQITQAEQGKPLGGILEYPPIAHLAMAKQAFDDAERVFHLGANAGLGLLQPLLSCILIAKGGAFSAMQQRLCLGHVRHMAGPHGMDIHTGMRLHAEVPLLALLALMHLGGARSPLILGQGRDKIHA